MNYYDENNRQSPEQPIRRAPSDPADFRRRARAALKGCYFTAVLVAVIVLFFGFVNNLSMPQASLTDGKKSENQFVLDGKYKGNYFAKFLNMLDNNGKEEISDKIYTSFCASEKLFTLIGLVFLPLNLGVWIILCGIRMGEKLFFLGISNGGGAFATPKTLFSRFNLLGKGVLLSLLTSILVALWSMLLLIPGIIAIFRYSMAMYIIVENPDMPVIEAMRRSKEMMKGNKWRLFCLYFSFIGWFILVALSAGVGQIFLYPYIETAKAEFYKEIKAEEMY